MASAYRVFPFACVFAATGLTAADSPEGIAFFEKEVRPIMVEHCYECHSADAKKLRGELYLDSKPGWQTGGDTGPAIIPGDADGSLMIRAVRYREEDIEMPPKQRLPQTAIDTLVRWVTMGAPDPRTEAAAPAPQKIDIEEGRKFWSFQPVEKPEVPAVNDETWPRNEIDRFVLAKLEEEELSPAPDADVHTRLRRLYVDLIGLPPEAELADGISEGELADIPARLLASPQFGERWARHWLDLARYADSSGGGASNVFPDAWKYRDHIVRSYNDDVPFDTFAARQLAGDLLPAEDTEERYENLVATGFLVLGPRNYINDDEEAFHLDGADEQLDAVGRVFLGMTLGCARCHDHKFDPIPMTDYYALAGIFTSTETSDPIPATTNFVWNEVADPDVDPDGKKLAAYESAYAYYRGLAKKYARASRDGSLGKDELEALATERKAAQDAVPKKPPVLMAANDAESIQDEKRRIRGNPHQSAETVPRGFMQVALPTEKTVPAISRKQSGRRELAEWINSPDNPLATRVYVNRVWTHLMGRGIVPTVDNFGTTGEAPTHPELLDWLACWFRENGQSTKKLVELIVNSRTYQLGAVKDEHSALLAGDPANQLFGRRTRRTLDAETLRDSILAVSGTLDSAPVERPFPEKLKTEFEYSFSGNFRRGIYLPRFRNNLPEIFETFDVANPATVVGRRDLTILSPQALYLMNNPFVRGEAEKAARRFSAKGDIRTAYLATLSRPPTADELRIATEYLEGADTDESRLERWTDFQQNLFACIDFRFLR